jgi:hypothetical protein
MFILRGFAILHITDELEDQGATPVIFSVFLFPSFCDIAWSWKPISKGSS